jgi:hypothetical protein
MQEAIDGGLKAYTGTIGEAIEHATEAVYRRFDRIAEILLGGDGKKVPISALAARGVEAGMPVDHGALALYFVERGKELRNSGERSGNDGKG